VASAKDDKQFKYDAGNTLLALREKAGMTQPELAEKIHVEPNSVHRYEKGERQMNLHTAYEASVAFGVPMESLIPDSYKENGQEAKKPSEKEEKAAEQPNPALAEAIKQLLMLDPKYQDLIVSEINALALRQSLM
jgi:transcriptional regulator with XRE-family HTH domain